MRGDLCQSSLADVFRHLYAERKNGFLHLARAGVTRRIYFKKGVPIFAEGPDKPFSTREQAEALLYSVFTWTSGEFSFEEGEASVDPGRALAASPSAVILEGSRRIEDPATLQFLTGGPASVYACTQSSVLPLFTMKLLASESAILAFARERERFTVRDLPLGAGALSTVSALNALVSVGLLEIVDKGKVPEPAPPVGVAERPSPVPPAPPGPVSPAPARPRPASSPSSVPPPPKPAPPPKRKLAASQPPAPVTPSQPPIPGPAVVVTAPQAKPRPTPAPPPVPRPVVAAEPPAAETVPQQGPAPPAPQVPEVLAAPVPSAPEAVPSAPAQVRSEVEELLDTFEAKRAGAPVAPAEPLRRAAAPLEARPMETPSPPPKTIPTSSPPPPAVSPGVSRATSEPTVAPIDAPDPRTPTPEEPPAPPYAEPVPSVEVSAPRPREGPVPASPRPPSKSRPWVELAAEWIPRGRTGVILGVSISLLLLAVVVGTWRSSHRKERPAPDAVVASETTPDEVERPVGAPESSAPPPQPAREPTDAELFYNANLAFENGDYQQSRSELEVLLARQPDFGPGRELLARIDRELAPKPKVEEPPRAPTKVVETMPAPKPEPEPAPEPVKAAVPEKTDPAALLDEARGALARGDLATAEAKLRELDESSPSYPGSAKLRDDLVERRWEKKLPIVLHVRHDHALGGCDGVLSLTPNGFSYRSKEHEWVWSFAEIAETERRDAKRLRLETKGRASFNFELKSALSEQDWIRHQALARR